MEKKTMSAKFNDAFWKWFGDSKVVDKNGEPLVVYHGTRSQFDRFKTPSYFAESADYADFFTLGDNGFILPAYLRIERPLDVTGFGLDRIKSGDFMEFLVKAGVGIKNIFKDYYDNYRAPVWHYVREMTTGKLAGETVVALDAANYDGLVQWENNGALRKSRVWLALSKVQVKSATGNDGTFDSNDPDIRSNPQFWGRAGAGILFVCDADKTIMTVLRSDEVLEPGTWALPGGSCNGEAMASSHEGQSVSKEEAWRCAVKETKEEIGYFPKKYKIVDKIVFKKDAFAYTTFVVAVDKREKQNLYEKAVLNWENDDLAWATPKETERRGDLHFGLKYILEQL